jgi:hypothetical protein
VLGVWLTVAGVLGVWLTVASVVAGADVGDVSSPSEPQPAATTAAPKTKRSATIRWLMPNQ